MKFFCVKKCDLFGYLPLSLMILMKLSIKNDNYLNVCLRKC